MRGLVILLIAVLIVLLGVGAYFVYMNLPTEEERFEEFSAELDYNFSGNMQFYPDMRYRDERISYWIEPTCSPEKRESAETAFSIIEEKTVLDFYYEIGGEIGILCSNVQPEPEEEGHFVAGEGGPSEIINASRYNVILSGRAALYRDNLCDKPNVAIHEILHTLGFDHVSDENSIMYPVTNCEQEIDSSVIEEIDRLYSVSGEADLLVEGVSASKSGRYLNFNITIANYGLKDVDSSRLNVYEGGKSVKEFDMGEIGIGSKKIFSVENLGISRSAKEVEFEVVYEGDEIDKGNNVVMLSLTG